MRIRSAVIGGGGFLGRHIVRRLLERGDHVRVLGRSHHADLERVGARSLVADVRSLPALTQALLDTSEVYHAAALAELSGPRSRFYETNVVGARNVVEACQRAGVAKLVHTSSPSVVFGGAPQRGVDETVPYPKRWLAAYPWSKCLAEVAVLQANARRGLHTASLRPHLLWGPGDTHVLPRLIQASQDGRLLRVGDGTNRVDFTYVENAADAHLLAAAELGPAGRSGGKAYFITQGRPVKLWEFVAEVLERAGAPPVRRAISFRRAYALGVLCERLSSRPRMTRFLACQLAMDHHYDPERAWRDFGYRPLVALEEGLRRTFGASPPR
jgi:nucleoside-diphosphate-sugar epimerase